MCTFRSSALSIFHNNRVKKSNVPIWVRNRKNKDMYLFLFTYVLNPRKMQADNKNG